jgi:hypothetical protein
LLALHLGHEALLGFHAASACHAAHAFEHLGHLGVLAEEVVGLIDRRAASSGDGLAANGAFVS